MHSQPEQTLPFHLNNPPDMLVQEYIHGHRFNTDQEAYMILLEALTIINEKPLGKSVPTKNSHERIEYNLHHKKKIRFLIFKDQNLSRINADKLVSNEKKWNEWKKRANLQYNKKSGLIDEFSFLDEIFDRNLDNLDQAVRLLRSMELDVMNKRRWTSKFLCITGPEMIFPDFREANGKWSADRRFFGRGGEIVYLMLNRSNQCEEVQNLIKNQILDTNDPYNRIAKSISPEEIGASKTEIGYLPCPNHPSYDRLASSWIKILQQDSLTGSHFFDPLFRITGLNLLVYLAERAQEVIGIGEVEPLLIDLTDGKNSQLRQVSKNNLNLHRELQNDAVKAFIIKRVESEPDWQTALDIKSGNKAATVIENIFQCDINSDQSFDTYSPEDVLKSFIKKAQSRSHNNSNRYFLSLSRQIGLATSRGGVGTWLAMDDLMIMALVMSVVDKTIELSEFLTKLYETYYLVIGPVEARKAYTKLPISNKSFEENLGALEKRMTRLALTLRLSDDCAFVVNPFRINHV